MQRRSIVGSFAKGVVDKRFHEFKNVILSLRDGETKMLNRNGVRGDSDYWDRDLKYNDYIRAGDIDGLNSLGHVKLNSRGNFRATRRGNAVFLNGYVNHSVDDDYNFNPDDVYYDHYYRMEKEGKARPFPVSGKKREKLKGK